MKLIRRLIDVLVPATCLSCGGPADGTRDDLSLCLSCRALVRRIGPHCSGCGCPLEGDRCGPCIVTPPPYRRLLFLWVYGPPLDAVLLGLKFRRLDYLAAQIARILFRELGEHLMDFDVVTAVPLHWSRHLVRGYNQAELVARPLAQSLGLPYRSLVRKKRSSPPQRLLPRARRLTGLRGVFSPLPQGPRGEGRVLLVDDVVTTGATLAAAARCCLAGGATSVTALAFARTPLPGEGQHQNPPEKPAARVQHWPFWPRGL